MKKLINSIQNKEDKVLAIGLTIAAIAIVTVTLLTAVINAGTIS